MPQELDAHYWAEAADAEDLRTQLLAMRDQQSPHALALRQALAAELLALEAHLQRELSEAAYLAVGHRAIHP